MLVTLTNTLDEVEAPFYVTMKLEYQDSTPEDFQLPAFQPMEVQTITHMFERAPFSMCSSHLHACTPLLLEHGSEL